ncbi:N-acetylmuramoyl-L-alanine amidase [Chelativorans salis]|uniref:N-acetylmuramoyl-L-alanine amidase n=1 Tax=Chelativorans salis TaxID=2978478 RepID=UPI0021B26D89|nr:N-acetylmuramoyl-L-alanine amidase [Chelativorans sp. EGI FJ00035]
MSNRQNAGRIGWLRFPSYKVGRAALPPIWLLRSLALALFAVFVLADSVTAEESPQPFSAYNYKMAGDQQRTRIVMRFDRKPDINWFLLRAPHRLVVDLPETKFAIDEAELAPRGLVAKVRYGKMGDGHSRMVFTLEGPFLLDNLAVLENETSPGYRLIVDVVSASEDAFEAAMRERIAAAPDAGTAADKPKPQPDDDRFTVAIDPGHGGIDSGAHGVNGTLEKTITLAFGLELKNKLEETGKYNVVLTRDTDIFLRLDERVRIARENGADLLISIHADSIRQRGFGGATVYTLSDKASDAEAAATAARENFSDALAGIVVKEEKEDVTDILADLIRRETHAFSIHFARSLIGELTDTVNLVNNPLRSAGFRVLRAPDVPSVLLELGYLTNPKEEEQMRDADWRARAAANIVDAIAIFAAVKAKAGG